MYIFVAVAKRNDFMLALEDRTVLLEGQEEFAPSKCQDEELFDHHYIQCTQEVWATLKPITGGRQSPKVIADAEAEQMEGRVNVYIQNGSLKIAE